MPWAKTCKKVKCNLDVSNVVTTRRKRESTDQNKMTYVKLALVVSKIMPKSSWLALCAEKHTKHWHLTQHKCLVLQQPHGYMDQCKNQKRGGARFCPTVGGNKSKHIQKKRNVAGRLADAELKGCYWRKFAKLGFWLTKMWNLGVQLVFAPPPSYVWSPLEITYLLYLLRLLGSCPYWLQPSEEMTFAHNQASPLIG